MKNLLLSSETIEKFVPIIIVAVFLFLAVVIFLLLTRKGKSSHKHGNRKVISSEIDTKKSMALKIPFLSSSENNFLRSFQSVLPSEYVIFPKVNMEQLLLPYNNLAFFNIVRHKTLDFVIFLRKNMQPVVIVDIHDRTGVQKSIEEDDKYLLEALKNVGLPIVDYEIRQEYEPAELLSRFLDALDPLAIANLKKNRERYKS